MTHDLTRRTHTQQEESYTIFVTTPSASHNVALDISQGEKHWVNRSTECVIVCACVCACMCVGGWGVFCVECLCLAMEDVCVCVWHLRLKIPY